MSKALVIKNVDFSENALDTVVITIPCTGISFSENTISLTDYGTETIDYTVTPANTTDSVAWVSSNTDIVTVSDGVLTVVGIGTCTVTATCGNYSATVNVSVTITPSVNWEFGYLSRTNYTPNGLGVINSAYVYISSLGTGSSATEYRLYNDYLSYSAKCIKLPKNVASVTVTATNPNVMVDNASQASIFFYKDEPCSNQTFKDYIACMGSETTYNMRTEPTKTFIIPEGIEAIAFRAGLAGTYSSSDDPNDVASEAGLSITFNPVVPN